MSSISMPTVSPALRETANLKIEELKHFKDHFTKDIILNLNKAYDHHEARDAILARLTTLLHRMEAYELHAIVDNGFAMWTCRVNQAKDDKSITSEKLISMEQNVHHKLDEIANRLVMSEYYVVLMENALHSLDTHAGIGPVLNKISLEDDFEVIEEEVESVCAAFEEHAFAKKDIDVKAIEKYLDNLFDDAVGHVRLPMLRQQMIDYGDDLLSGAENLDAGLVRWCVEDLLENEMLSAETRAALQSYLQTEASMRELTDTLNAKSVRHWNWCNGEHGLPVAARKNAEGKYCITVEEDIIDMLFLHSLAVRWSMWMKDSLTGLTLTRARHVDPTSKEMQQREFYLQGSRPCHSVSYTTCPPQLLSGSAMRPRSSMHCPSPPPPPPPNCPPPRPANRRRRKAVSWPAHHFTTRNKQGRRSSRVPTMPPIPNGARTCIEEERSSFYMQEFFLSRLPKTAGGCVERANNEETQAALLEMLALDIKTRENFDGSIYGVNANFRAFASSLPHETILAVFEYIGVSQQWLGFFKRFLSTPLNMGSTSDKTRTRTSGMPIAHGFEAFFGETVLFCLDLAVHHRTTSDQTIPYLLRLRDQCYFVGKEKQCKQVRQEIKAFADVMGLNVSVEDLFPPASGPVPAIGLITFSRGKPWSLKSPSRVMLSVDNARVATYARRVKKQLAACPTVFTWVSTWNRTIGTYAPHLFGPIANVFGKAHLEAVKKAYNIMYEVIFDDGNLTQHVSDLILPLPPGDPSFSLEAWIHLPAAYGGLGVKKPYAYLDCADRNMLTDADTAWKGYLEEEQSYYQKVEKLFYGLTDRQREEKLKSMFDGDEDRMATVFGPDRKSSTATFPTLAELTANRERFNSQSYGYALNHFVPLSLPYNLSCDYPSHYVGPPPNPLATYKLLAPPETLHLNYSASARIAYEVNRLAGKLDMHFWDYTIIQDRWALEFYGEECLGRFGGLEIWYGEWVPRELLRVLKGEEYVKEDEYGTRLGEWY